MKGDLARLTSFFARDSERALEFLLLLDIEDGRDPSSRDVAAVVEELCDQPVMLLPAVLLVSVELRESFVRERRWPLIEPPKKSPMAEPGRAPNRLREMTSRPNIAAREREAVGVVGRDTAFVLNLNKPY